MVKKQHHETVQDDAEITSTDAEMIVDEPELAETENHLESKVKKLQSKLKEVEEKYRLTLEETQRAKADFLNAKKRLEEERLRDRERAATDHIERLLPVCDSFHLAMQNKEAWEKIDPVWRKGIEGVYAQLQSLLSSYQVTPDDPTSRLFDPTQHEALGNVPVTDRSEHDTIMAVVQLGYVRTLEDSKVVIRPARVMVGHYDE